MIFIILMDKSLKREEAREFLVSISPNYRTFSEFESWAEGYDGPFKEYLFEVVDYIGKRNSGNRNRGGNRVFELGRFEIETILDETIPLKAS